MRNVTPSMVCRLVRGQATLHPRLHEVVRRHLSASDRTPIPSHTQRAFRAVIEYIAAERASMVFDSGCGTGASTLRLAGRHPDSWVVGIDKSAARLRSGPAAGSLELAPGPAMVFRVAPRVLLARADMFAFWRLAAEAGARVAHHYLLYPNPWPKPAHLRRRVHGHPAFSALLALGGRLEVRSNWRVYVDEMAAALSVGGLTTPDPKRLGLGLGLGLRPATPLTPFEAKYSTSGHDLWSLVTELCPRVRGCATDRPPSSSTR